MKVETEVSAFVVRKDMVPHYKTLETAAKEVDEYDFMRICKDHYVCKHGENAYLITIDGDKIGCSCPAMTFHCKGNDVCKHLAAFDRRSAPQKQITADIAMSLLKAGWTGEPGNMTPPDTADAEHDALIDSAANAGWSKEHPEMTSDEDGNDNGGGDPVPPDAEKPELPEPKLGEKVYSRTCPHCNTRFDGTDLDEVKDRHRDHIPICPKNPANKQQPVSSKTELTETPPEQKPIVKDSLTPETQPEQEEETKMEQNTTEETTAIVPTVASTSIQTTELQQGFLTAAVTLDDAIAAFDMYGIAKTRLLGDADIMYIGAGGTPVKKDALNATPYIKKSGWRKMARFFGLSVDIVGKEKIWTEDVKGEKYYIWAYQIKVSHQCGAYVISEGVCSSRDKFFTKGGRAEADEKNVMLKAQTVGINRGISDLLGAGEVSAEEMD